MFSLSETAQIMHLSWDTGNCLFVKINIPQLLGTWCKIQLYQLEFFQ